MKEQYRDPSCPKKVSHVTFSIMSPAEMLQHAHVQCRFVNLYSNAAHDPSVNGVLDRRMGTSKKTEMCVTCNKDYHSCMGHFGFLDLKKPVYHHGYLVHVLKILQSICKSCSRVMLKPKDRASLLIAATRPDLSYLQKKGIRRRIHELAKKQHTCPHCGAHNGIVKKLQLMILYDKLRNLKPADLERYVKAFQQSQDVSKNAELQAMARKGLTTIRPDEAWRLFDAIPQTDLPLLVMNPSHGHPRDLILTRIPVPPNAIRPSVVSEVRAGTTEDDITQKIWDLAFLSQILDGQMAAKEKHNESKLQFAWDNLQHSATQLMAGNVSGIMPHMVQSKFFRSFIHRLKGKQGRFRGNLSGKRSNYTGRTVISPDPNMRIDQVCIPEHCAKILTYPELVTPHNLESLRQLVRRGNRHYPGAQYLSPQTVKNKIRLESAKVCDRAANDLKIGDTVERHLATGDIVLFNRQPSLHRLSIQAFQAVVKKNRTLRFNECCCGPFNADFDGDEMNIHLPQTEEAKAEAATLMISKKNIITPRNGEPLIAAIQDFITGAYLMTLRDSFFTKERFCEILSHINIQKDRLVKFDIPPPAILKPARLWTGKQLFSLIIRPNKECNVKVNLRTKTKAVYEKDEDMCPSDGYVVIHNSELVAGCLEKKTLGSGSKDNLFYCLLREFGHDVCADTMWRMTRLIPAYLSHRGFSIGIGDVTPGPQLTAAKRHLISQGFKTCEKFINDFKTDRLQLQPGCSKEQTLENVISKELSDIRDQCGKACKREHERSNAPLIMAKCGSKGSFLNISQMTACVGQQVINGARIPDGFEHRSLPHFLPQSRIPAAKGFVGNSFYDGLEATEFFFHTMSGREGLVDTAVKTADTGYMQRRIMKSLEDLLAHYDKTVRTSRNEVVQFVYGSDNFDPVEMETSTKPINLERLFHMVLMSERYRGDEILSPSQLITSTADVLKMNEYRVLGKEFGNQIMEFIETVAARMEQHYNRFKVPAVTPPPVFWEMERVTRSHFRQFMLRCREKFHRMQVEPGTPVGAICAQSIGEPATQMTLKTFHFAGVASMNITQGVPRIKEIINAVATISTPIITARLMEESREEHARRVKARIEQTTLGEVTLWLEEVLDADEVYIAVRPDLKRIELLQLEVSLWSIREAIVTSKLKSKIQQVRISDEEDDAPPELYVIPKDPSHMSFLRTALTEVVIKGLPSIRRAIIHREVNPNPCYVLFVEGERLGAVMATTGVDGRRTRSNNIREVAQVLGIEAARRTIIDEMLEVMQGHGVEVDMRHVMLLADVMTYRGEVLGNQRHGIAKLKESVLMLASFEMTADHLFEAAYHGQTDDLSGVTESIIMGMPMRLGTGMFNLMQKPTNADLSLKPRALTFDI